LQKDLPEVPLTPQTPTAFVPARIVPVPPLESWIDTSDDETPSPTSTRSVVSCSDISLTPSETPRVAEHKIIWEALAKEADEIRRLARLNEQSQLNRSVNMMGKLRKFKSARQLNWSERLGSHFEFD
jgi:hypothetical protein